MKRIKVVLDQKNDHFRRITEAVSIVNSAQNYFLLEIQEEFTEPACLNGMVIPEKSRTNISNKYRGESVIYIVSMRFDDNWFSHPHRECEIITIADWEKLFAPPSLRAYLIYHFAEALLTFEADLSEEMHVSFAHEPPQGCISDFCVHKPDVKLGMAAGNLCPVCEGILARYGMSANAIESLRRILDVVRSDAIGRPRVLDPDTAFIVIRFSQNDENSNAYRYGVEKGLEDVGIKPVRADDSVKSSQILEKIFRHIERARFVVAKVDVENLNVYYELGLGMGLGKDVLLISERSLVLNLPSDLRNWECLTYEKGNYEMLRKNIADFFETTYGRKRIRL